MARVHPGPENPYPKIILNCYNFSGPGRAYMQNSIPYQLFIRINVSHIRLPTFQRVKSVQSWQKFGTRVFKGFNMVPEELELYYII